MEIHNSFQARWECFIVSLPYVASSLTNFRDTYDSQSLLAVPAPLCENQSHKTCMYASLFFLYRGNNILQKEPSVAILSQSSSAAFRPFCAEMSVAVGAAARTHAAPAKAQLHVLNARIDALEQTAGPEASSSSKERPATASALVERFDIESYSDFSSK